jgi:hypothetical protein
LDEAAALIERLHEPYPWLHCDQRALPCDFIVHNNDPLPFHDVYAVDTVADTACSIMSPRPEHAVTCRFRKLQAAPARRRPS